MKQPIIIIRKQYFNIFSIAIYLLLISHSNTFSQQGRWDLYHKGNSGLPDNSITSIAIDASGVKWIGTDASGLIRYDGTTWTVYDIWNSKLPVFAINCVRIDGNGVKWIGMSKGGFASYDQNSSSIEEDGDINRHILQNYPNPFNPLTSITYDIPQRSEITLTVYSALGETISVLSQGMHEAGRYEVTFYAHDLPSGVYFYRLQAGDFVQTKKMVLMR